METLEDRRMLAEITVDSAADNTTDDGMITLREAIIAANNNAIADATEGIQTGGAGPDTIEFDIAGAGPHTIFILSALPDITEAITIDGYTQTGATVNTNAIGSAINADLRIELDGSGAGAGVNGLTISANDSTIRGLVINRFDDDGIEIITADNNKIEGNFIGTDVTGEIDLGNGDDGIYVINGDNNTIGGTDARSRNLISGNAAGGIHISAATSTGNIVIGNFIGTDKDGDTDLGNTEDGIRLDGSINNTIGGITTAARNVISGNDDDGVKIDGSNATGNKVLGNFIGTDLTGIFDLGNSNHGVQINGAPSNTVGGAAAGSRNVISGNNDDGIIITGSDATGNMVLGNYIGTDETGTVDLGNSQDGIIIDGASNNTIGGTFGVLTRNIVSGNGLNGVEIDGDDATDNLVLGNYIGTDVTGSVDMGNDFSGVLIDRAPGNTIGGLAMGARNLISGNNNHGVYILGEDADGNIVAGNYIGTNATGTLDLGNTADGVLINDGDDNTIGGLANGAGNLISGNNNNGIHLSGNPIESENATGNMVLGNLIGTNVNGTADLGNSEDGVFIESSSGNTIGGTTTAARNVISGNNDEGVEINGSAAIGNTVQGNFIGTDISGINPLANSRDGVEIVDGIDNLIGGVAPGAGNVIAFNGTEGVEVAGASATGNAIRRNSIFKNGEIGIDLSALVSEGDGITANDVDDPDAGANNLQNFPEYLGTALLVGNNIELTYLVPSLPANSAYPLEIEFFVADVDSEEGEIYFASDTYVAGIATTFRTISLPTHPLFPVRDIVATATDAEGNTSEFSAPLEVQKTPDRFEFNDTIAAATVLGSEETVIERDLNIFDITDEDFFKITAHDTGKLITQIFFDHDMGDLRLEVQDMHGNVIATSDSFDSVNNFEEIIIPVVAQEMYFVRVTSNEDVQVCYDLEIENFAAPVPEMPFLHPEDDNGPSNSDNITSVLNPRIFIQADLADFAAMGIDILTAAEAAGGVDDGAAVEVFVNGISQGFADPVGASNTLFQFQLDTAVLENGLEVEGGYFNFISAAVRMFDGQSDGAGEPSPISGRTQLSKPLELRTPIGGAKIGAWARGTVLIDSNGNFQADVYSGPFTEGDTAFRIGYGSDYIFAGKFAFPLAPALRDDVAQAEVNGFPYFSLGYDTIAAYGRVNGNQFRWLIDTDGNGAADFISFEPVGAGINGYPVAGEFDGNPFNGDEIGLFDGKFWYFDTDHDFKVSDETPIQAFDYSGFPIAGDFDGDGFDKNGKELHQALVDYDNDGDDDVATYIASSAGGDLFSVDLNTAAFGDPIEIDGFADFSFQVGSPTSANFGFAGTLERPVAADFNADGIDDFGLWVPGGLTPVPNELGEWFLLLSGDDPFTPKYEAAVLDRIEDGPLNGFVPFSPAPFGNDIYAQFGNNFSLPIAGDFGPPVASLPDMFVQQAPNNPPTVVSQITVPTLQPVETPVVPETPPPPPEAVAPQKQPLEEVEEEVEQEVVAVIQARGEAVPETPPEPPPSKETPVAPVEEKVEEKVEAAVLAAEQPPIIVTEPAQPLSPPEASTITEPEVPTVEPIEEIVVEQPPAEPVPAVAAIATLVVEVIPELPPAPVTLAAVEPVVPTQSYSRVRSLSYAYSGNVATISTQSVPVPLAKPAEPQPTPDLEPLVRNAGDPPSASTVELPSVPAKAIPESIPVSVVENDSADSESTTLQAISPTVSEPSKSTYSRTRSLFFTHSQYIVSSNNPTSAGPSANEAALADAIFEDNSNIEFRRIDPDVVLSLSLSDQDPAEETASRNQRARLLVLADDLD